MFSRVDYINGVKSHTALRKDVTTPGLLNHHPDRGMIGRTISHYTVVEKLGEGGMGVVYKARDNNLDRFVALKFLPPDLTRDQDARRRFTKEAQSASALDHPNISVVHEIGETDDGHSFICMTYYDGTLLKDKIASGVSTPEEATRIALQIADGLGRAHEAGIVHCDIKPANIIVTRREEVKILDFGVARLRGQLSTTRSSSHAGTIAYMSPEQATGSEIDHRTDLFSLGIVLYEMVTGQRPFVADHEPALFYSILNVEPAAPSSLNPLVPAELEKIIMRLLEKEPSRRFPDAASLRLALQEIGSGDPPSRAGILRRVFPAAAALIIAGLFFLILLPRFMGPDHTSKTKWRIVVLPFLDMTKQPETADWPVLIQTMIVEELTGIEQFGIVEPFSFNNVLQSSFGSIQPARDNSLYAKIREAGVAFVIDGALLRGRDSYLIRVNVTNVSTEEVAFSREVDVSFEDDLPGAVSNVSESIVGYFQAQELSGGRDEDMRPWINRPKLNTRAIVAFVQAMQLSFNGIPGAERHLLRAVELDSAFIAPRIRLAYSAARGGRREEALRHYEVLQRLEGQANPLEQAMIQWVAAVLARDTLAQLRQLRQALEYSPGNNILLAHVAQNLYLLRDYEGSLGAMSPTIEQRWQYSPVYLLSAICYDSLHQYGKAKEVLGLALNFKFVHPDIFGLLSRLEFRDRDTVRGRHYEERYIRARREAGLSMTSIHATLARQSSESGLFENALYHARVALKSDPNDPDASEILADAYSRRGELQPALEAYQRTIANDSLRFTIHRKMGRLYEASNSPGRAVEQYQLYLARDSTSSVAIETKQWLERLRR